MDREAVFHHECGQALQVAGQSREQAPAAWSAEPRRDRGPPPVGRIRARPRQARGARAARRDRRAGAGGRRDPRDPRPQPSDRLDVLRRWSSRPSTRRRSCAHAIARRVENPGRPDRRPAHRGKPGRLTGVEPSAPRGHGPVRTSRSLPRSRRLNDRFDILARAAAAQAVEGRDGTCPRWFVFTHLVGLVLFVFAHGASAFVTYQIRTMRDPAVVSGYLTLSQQAVGASYVGLLLLLVGGAGAAWSRTRCGPALGVVVDRRADRGRRRGDVHGRVAVLPAAAPDARRKGRRTADRLRSPRDIPRIRGSRTSSAGSGRSACWSWIGLMTLKPG